MFLRILSFLGNLQKSLNHRRWTHNIRPHNAAHLHNMVSPFQIFLHLFYDSVLKFLEIFNILNVKVICFCGLWNFLFLIFRSLRRYFLKLGNLLEELKQRRMLLENLHESINQGVNSTG